MKKIFLFATALLALASCTSDDYVGDQSLMEANSQAAISFNSASQAITRADKSGADAATDLDNHFYVYGIKNESSDGAGNVKTGNLVYNNYVVKYAASTAYTTTSNTQNWEYVGYALDANEQTQVVANSAAATQTIKYWDWGAADYTFYAVSAAATDITNKYVTITKVQDKKTSDSPAHTVYDNGYTVVMGTSADLDKLFFAERVNITPTNNTDRTQDNTYGGNVTFRFHNMATKVRVAMYETVPGYTVTIDKFMTQASTTPTFDGMTTGVTDNFAANFVNNAKGTAGTLTVKYVADGTTKNHPTASFAQTGDAANVLALGTNLKATTVLGENVGAATYDYSDKKYTSVFPKEDNAQSLKLKVNYTLTAPVTGEKITVEGATAEIPASYLKWKPGYAYTYIFKISDNTNGQTGTGETPAGLYPITFDATEVVAEDGTAEYITTVSEPSITTFGVKDGKYVAGGSEYAVGSVIYATIMENSVVVTPEEGDGTGKVNYYSIAYKTGATAAEKAAFPITEASVAESIAKTAATTKMIVCTKNNDLGAPVTEVPGEDGVNITQKAVKFTSLAAGTYAIEYTPTSGSKVYKVIVVQ